MFSLVEIFFLLRNGYFIASLKYVAYHFFRVLDDFLLALEAEPENLSSPVFILGAQRSGTTALHESIYKSASPKVRSLTFLETAVRSSFLRASIRPVVSLVSHFLDCYSTDGHCFGAFALSEEHLLLDRLVLFLIPELLSCLPEHRIVEYMRLSKNDLKYIRKVIGRGDKSSQYIGKPLDLTMNITELQEAFPEAKYIICRRNFADCYMSYVTLLYNIHHPNTKQFHNICVFAAKYILGGIHRSLVRIDQKISERSLIEIDFKSWCHDSIQVLNNIEMKFSIKMPKKIIYKDGKSTSLRKEFATIAERALLDQKFATEFVHPIITLFRLPYHINFMIVIIGYVLCLDRPMQDFNLELVGKVYFTFCWLLYTGLYSFNGYQDYHQDNVEKPWRQEWSQHAYFIASMSFLSFSMIACYQLMIPMDIILVYIYFVVINIGYSWTKKWYRSIYLEAAISAITAPLRLYLGSELARTQLGIGMAVVDISIWKYLMCWINMTSVHIVRKERKLSNFSIALLINLIFGFAGSCFDNIIYFWVFSIVSTIILFGNPIIPFYALFV